MWLTLSVAYIILNNHKVFDFVVFFYKEFLYFTFREILLPYFDKYFPSRYVSYLLFMKDIIQRKINFYQNNANE